MNDMYVVIYPASAIAAGDLSGETPDEKLLAAVADVPADAMVSTLIGNRQAAIAFAQKAKGSVHALGRLVYRNSGGEAPQEGTEE